MASFDSHPISDEIEAPPLDIHDEIDPKATLAADDKHGLVNIGKKPVFTRRFNLWTAVGITFCGTGSWEGLSGTLFQALVVGGPVALLYGFILCGVCIIFVALSLAEYASMWPSSGAQYHWTAELAPKKFRAALSWVAGWFSFMGMACASILCAMGSAMQIQASAIIANDNYAAHAERWHVYLIYLGICLFYLSINVFAVALIHPINNLGSFLHIAGYLVIVIVLAVLTNDKHDASYVFTTFQNYSGWDNDGVAFCIGIMTSMNAFPAVEIAAHFAEEIKHASRNVPKAMIITVTINFALVFGFIIIVLYCIGDLDALLANPVAILSPFVLILQSATGSTGGAIALNALSLYSAFIGGLDISASCARTMWAMARDNAFPEVFGRIHPTFNVPTWCLITLTIFQSLIGMIFIWNTTAFYGVTSGSLVLLCASSFLPVSLHLIRRWQKKNNVRGQWTLGRFGFFCNVIAGGWLAFIIIFMSFPIYQPVTANNMNYASLIVGGIMILSMGVYFFYARSRFVGPLLEIAVGETLENSESQTVGNPIDADISKPQKL